MSFDNDTEFAGRKVVDYKHDAPLPDDLEDICLHVRCTYGSEDTFPADACDGMERGNGYFDVMAHGFGWFVKQPFTPRIQALSLGMMGEEGGYIFRQSQVLAETAANFPALRHLFIGNIAQHEAEASWIAAPNVPQLLAAFPHLETLKIRAGEWPREAFDASEHDKLKTLIIESGSIPAHVLEWLAASSFPALEMLEVWTGDPDYGGIAEVGPLRPLLMSDKLPALRHLGLRNCAFGDDLVMAITHAPLVKQLDVLDLSRSTLTDRGADALTRSKAALAHLSQIDLSENFISDDKAASMASDLPNLDLSDQREFEDWGDGPQTFLWVAE